MAILERLDAFTLRFADRLDPMLVRCVRQDLRSKVFVGVFSLLLLVSTIWCLVMAAQAGDRDDSQQGMWLFAGLGWCWSFALIVVQALTTHHLVAQERNDDTWDLVELTGLPPRRIVRGLLFASLVQSALYTAALAPFMVMAYLLRGIDLLTIAAALITVPMLGVLAAGVALVFSCAAPSKKSRAGSSLLVLMLMIGGWITTSSLQFNGGRFGVGTFLRDLGNGDVASWFGAGAIVNGWLALTWLFLVLSTTLLTHRANDRSSRPRSALLLVWVNLLLWLVPLILINAGGAAERGAMFAAVALGGSLLLVASAFFALTEDDSLSPRQARVIREARGWRGAAMVILGPGAARARWFVLAFALLVLPLLLMSFAGDADDGRRWSVLRYAWYTFGYGVAVILVADGLARTVFLRWCSGPLQRRLVVMAVASAWTIIPAVAGALVPDDGALRQLLALACPLWAVPAFGDQQHGEWPSMVLALLPVVVIAVLVVQGRRLALVTHRVTAVADDRNPRA